MNKYEKNVRSRQAIVARIGIKGAILIVRRYKNGRVSIWPYHEKGETLGPAYPIMKDWGAKIGAKKDGIAWRVEQDQAEHALRTIFRLKGSRIIELHPSKLGAVTLAHVPLWYWVSKLAKFNKQTLQ